MWLLCKIKTLVALSTNEVVLWSCHTEGKFCPAEKPEAGKPPPTARHTSKSTRLRLSPQTHTHWYTHARHDSCVSCQGSQTLPCIFDEIQVEEKVKRTQAPYLLVNFGSAQKSVNRWKRSARMQMTACLQASRLLSWELFSPMKLNTSVIASVRAARTQNRPAKQTS